MRVGSSNALSREAPAISVLIAISDFMHVCELFIALRWLRGFCVVLSCAGLSVSTGGFLSFLVGELSYWLEPHGDALHVVAIVKSYGNLRWQLMRRVN